jgi:signal peptidase I
MSEPLRQEGVSFFRASGQSMWPFIRDGQRLIVKSALLSDLKPGDIIVYKADRAIVCHRVVAKRGPAGQAYCLVRGDNARGAPERVGEPMIVGLVCGTIRGTKSVRWQGAASAVMNRVVLFVAPVIARLNAVFNHYRKI